MKKLIKRLKEFDDRRGEPDDVETYILQGWNKGRFGIYRTPFCLETGEWVKWKKHIKSKHPIQYFFRETVFNKIRFLCNSFSWDWYAIKCKYWRKYNIIKVKNVPDNSWVDRSTLLTEVIPQLLVEFVDGEKPFDHFDTENSITKDDWIKLKQLYIFFKEERPKLEKEIEAVSYKLHSTENGSFDEWLEDLNREKTDEEMKPHKELWKMEEDLEKKVTENLMEVVRLRQLLWT